MIFEFENLITKENKVLELIKCFNGQRKNLLLTYINQHCFNVYNKHPIFKNVIDNEFYIYMDGIGVFLALKFLGLKNVQKFNASDLNERILNNYKASNDKIFIVGSKFSEMDINFIKNKGVNVCGYQNGFFTSKEEQRIINNIMTQDPKVIIIGMGVPKQELFASKLNEYLDNKIIICVGNFLEFYVGKIKRIPKHFRNLGLEWLYRTIQEPSRLWKRYLGGIPRFVISIIIIKIKILLFHKDFSYYTKDDQ